MLKTLTQDLRYGARMLRRSPAFTAAALISLALGIGANSAIFSVVNSVLLNPLPYPDADRLMWGWGRTPSGATHAAVSPPDFRDYAGQNHTFEHWGAYFVLAPAAQNWTSSGQARQLRGSMVTADFFETLGVAPVAGRRFTVQDERADHPEAVVISYRLWQQAFGGAADVAGKTARLDGSEVTVVGVMPASFDFPRNTDLWFAAPLEAKGLQRRMAHMFRVVGRLKPGVSRAQAQEDLNAIGLRLGEAWPETNKGWGITLEPMKDAIVGPVRPVLLLLLGAVGLVLLIACVNIANLLLARYGARQREIAIRTAIGADRWRILRQLIAENLLLAFVAGSLAVMVAYWGVELLRNLGPSTLPRLAEVRLNGQVVAFTALISAITAFLFGLAPAWLASGAPGSGLRQGGRAGSSRQRRALGAALVVGETALSICLLIAAALLIQSLFRTLHAVPGFSPQGVLSTEFMLPARDAAGTVRFVERIMAAVRALPGVEAAGAISELPLNHEYNDTFFRIVERPVQSASEKLDEDFRRVVPGYFQAMRIPLLRGRLLNERDAAGSAPALLVDEPFARTYFPDGNAVGRHIQLNVVYEIVGVVGAVRNHTLQTSPRPTMYLPFNQEQSDALHLVVRSSADPTQLAGPIRRIIAAEDPEVGLAAFDTLEEVVSRSVSDERFHTLLLGLFAAMALALAVAGVYGVFSYVVTQRTHEIGIRMALGAKPGQMLRLVLGGGLRLAGMGAALGILAAFFLMQVLAAQLYEVKPRDPITFAVAASVLVAAALAGCLAPARRAARVDPMVALRHE